MPLERKPDPLPSTLDYVPPDSTPRLVCSNEDFDSLTVLPGWGRLPLSANDLAFFNFKTRDPWEINWYLYHRVGCRRVTHDGKNYMFSTHDRQVKEAAQPGIIHLPKVPSSLPVDQFPKKDESTNAWLGIVGKGGAMVAVVGIETAAGWAVSLDGISKGMAITVSTTRLGVGWGASGGATFVFITGVKQPSQLNGFQTGGGDFNIALGGNYGKWVKSAMASKRIAPLVEALTKIGAKTPAALKMALKTKPESYADLVKAGKAVMDYAGLSPNGQPDVIAFDVPFASGGAEVSVFHGVSTYYAVFESL